mgnify:CR=1 FL=1
MGWGYCNDVRGAVGQNCGFHGLRDGDSVLRRGEIGHIVKMHCFFVSLLFAWAWIGKRASIVILGFMPPGRGFLCWGVVMKWICNISSPLLIYTGAWIGRDGYKVVLTEKGSVRVVNFITSGTGGRVLGRWYVVIIVNMHYLLLCRCASFLLSCWGNMMLLSYGTVDCRLFFDWAVGVRIHVGPSGERSVWSLSCSGGPWVPWITAFYD